MQHATHDEPASVLKRKMWFTQNEYAVRNPVCCFLLVWFFWCFRGSTVDELEEEVSCVVVVVKAALVLVVGFSRERFSSVLYFGVVLLSKIELRSIRHEVAFAHRANWRRGN